MRYLLSFLNVRICRAFLLVIIEQLAHIVSRLCMDVYNNKTGRCDWHPFQLIYCLEFYIPVVSQDIGKEKEHSFGS